MLIVCPLKQVQAMIDRHGARHVVSMLAPETPHPEPVGIRPGRHLRLSFHDIAEPREGHQPPSAGDIDSLIGFLSDWDRQHPMVIHCWAGISRSTAAAYTALCLFRPDTDESELALELRQASPSATPNRLIVALADAAMERNGRMVRAVEAIGRGAEAFEGQPFTLAT
jgi:predicted protein tyrosine phosphatase